MRSKLKQKFISSAAILGVSLIQAGAPVAIQAANPASQVQVYRDDSRKELLFRIENQIQKTGEGGEVLRRNTFGTEASLPPGADLKKPAVSEAFYRRNGEVLRFEEEFPHENEKGSAELRGDKIIASHSKNGKVRTEEMEHEPGLVFGGQVAELFLEKMSRLLQGEKIKFRIFVIERLETFGFEARLKKKEGDELQVEMKPSSFVISAFVSPIIFTYRVGPKALNSSEKVGNVTEYSLLHVKGSLKARIWRDGSWHRATGFTLIH